MGLSISGTSDAVVVRQTFSNVAVTVTAGTTVLAQTGTMSAARIITFPAASAYAAGNGFWVTDESGTVTTTNKLTPTRAGSDTINGGTSLDLTMGYCSTYFVSDGSSKWTVLAGTDVRDSTASTGARIGAGGGLTMGSASSFIQGSSFANFLITNPLIRYPSSSPTVGLNYGGSSGLAIINDGTTSTANSRDLKLRNITVDGTTSNAGHVTFATDNTYDIGASGATRPRNLYLAGSIVASGTVSLGSSEAAAAGAFYWTGRVRIRSSAAANLLLQDVADTSFGLLQFGGTTSSFPALKRSTTSLQGKLADDSAFCPVQAKITTDTNATAGLTAGVLAALTNASIVIYDASGQAYRVPCII